MGVLILREWLEDRRQSESPFSYLLSATAPFDDCVWCPETECSLKKRDGGDKAIRVSLVLVSSALLTASAAFREGVGCWVWIHLWHSWNSTPQHPFHHLIFLIRRQNQSSSKSIYLLLHAIMILKRDRHIWSAQIHILCAPYMITAIVQDVLSWQCWQRLISMIKPEQCADSLSSKENYWAACQPIE